MVARKMITTSEIEEVEEMPRRNCFRAVEGIFCAPSQPLPSRTEVN